MNYINIDLDNIEKEHLCCAISDKKHQDGVTNKKEWLKERIKEGHVFRKLDDRGKVFIEYAPLEKAFVPITGDNYMYIYCLWSSGKFKGHGHGKALIEYAINDAKKRKMNGICILSANKKRPFLSDPKFIKKYKFELVDKLGEYNLMCLNFNEAPLPKFISKNNFEEKGVHVFYNNQCPYTIHCIEEMKSVNKDLVVHEIKTLKEAKNSPILMNNFAVIKDGVYVTHELLNANRYKKMVS